MNKKKEICSKCEGQGTLLVPHEYLPHCLEGWTCCNCGGEGVVYKEKLKGNIRECKKAEEKMEK